MAEQYSPYTVADPFLNRPEIASRRLYWSTQNDFAAGRRANFNSTSGGSGARDYELGRANFAPGMNMGAVRNAGINPNFDRLLSGPNRDIQRAQSAIDTMHKTVQGVRGAVAVNRMSRAVARGNAANQQAQNTLAGLNAQNNLLNSYLPAATGNRNATTLYGNPLPLSVKQSMARTIASNPTGASTPAGTPTATTNNTPVTAPPTSRGSRRIITRQGTSGGAATPSSTPTTPITSGPPRRGSTPVSSLGGRPAGASRRAGDVRPGSAASVGVLPLDWSNNMTTPKPLNPDLTGDPLIPLKDPVSFSILPAESSNLSTPNLGAGGSTQQLPAQQGDPTQKMGILDRVRARSERRRLENSPPPPRNNF